MLNARLILVRVLFGAVLAATGCGDAESESATCGEDSCTEDEICDVHECSLEEGEATQFCAARPTSCDESGDPVCGEDGEIYANECEARRAGVLPGASSSCETPAGLVACGASGYCDPATELCEYTSSDCDGGSAACVPLPAACAGVPSCDCVDPAAMCTGSPSCELRDGLLDVCG